MTKGNKHHGQYTENFITKLIYAKKPDPEDPKALMIPQTDTIMTPTTTTKTTTSIKGAIPLGNFYDPLPYKFPKFRTPDFLNHNNTTFRPTKLHRSDDIYTQVLHLPEQTEFRYYLGGQIRAMISIEDMDEMKELKDLNSMERIKRGLRMARAFDAPYFTIDNYSGHVCILLESFYQNKFKPFFEKIKHDPTKVPPLPVEWDKTGPSFIVTLYQVEPSEGNADHIPESIEFVDDDDDDKRYLRHSTGGIDMKGRKRMDCELDEFGMFKFEPHQYNILKEFTISSASAGIMILHSTGAGKTCTVTNLVSKNFQGPGDYSLIWTSPGKNHNEALMRGYIKDFCSLEARRKIDAKPNKVETLKLFREANDQNAYNKLATEYSMGLAKRYMKTYEGLMTFIANHYNIKNLEYEGKVYTSGGDKDKSATSNPIDRRHCYIIDEGHNMVDVTNPYFSAIVVNSPFTMKDIYAKESHWFSTDGVVRGRDLLAKFFYDSYKKFSDFVRPIIITGTPMSSSPNDFFWLINLLHRDPNKRIDLVRNNQWTLYVNPDNYELKPEMLAKLKASLTKNTSYAPANKDPTKFAQKMLSDIKHVRLLSCHLSVLKNELDAITREKVGQDNLMESLFDKMYRINMISSEASEDGKHRFPDLNVLSKWYKSYKEHDQGNHRELFHHILDHVYPKYQLKLTPEDELEYDNMKDFLQSNFEEAKRIAPDFLHSDGTMKSRDEWQSSKTNQNISESEILNNKHDFQFFVETKPGFFRVMERKELVKKLEELSKQPFDISYDEFEQGFGVDKKAVKKSKDAITHDEFDQGLGPTQKKTSKKSKEENSLISHNFKPTPERQVNKIPLESRRMYIELFCPVIYQVIRYVKNRLKKQPNIKIAISCNTKSSTDKSAATSEDGGKGDCHGADLIAWAFESFDSDFYITHADKPSVTNKIGCMYISQRVDPKINHADLEDFNSTKANPHGEKYQVLIYDSASREGMDLYDTPVLIMIEPCRTRNDIEQTSSRIARMCKSKNQTYYEGIGAISEVVVFCASDREKVPIYNMVTDMNTDNNRIIGENLCRVVMNITNGSAVDFLQNNHLVKNGVTILFQVLKVFTKPILHYSGIIMYNTNNPIKVIVPHYALRLPPNAIPAGQKITHRTMGKTGEVLDTTDNGWHVRWEDGSVSDVDISDIVLSANQTTYCVYYDVADAIAQIMDMNKMSRFSKMDKLIEQMNEDLANLGKPKPRYTSEEKKQVCSILMGLEKQYMGNTEYLLLSIYDLLVQLQKEFLHRTNSIHIILPFGKDPFRFREDDFIVEWNGKTIRNEEGFSSIMQRMKNSQTEYTLAFMKLKSDGNNQSVHTNLLIFKREGQELHRIDLLGKLRTDLFHQNELDEYMKKALKSSNVKYIPETMSGIQRRQMEDAVLLRDTCRLKINNLSSVILMFYAQNYLRYQLSSDPQLKSESFDSYIESLSKTIDDGKLTKYMIDLAQRIRKIRDDLPNRKGYNPELPKWMNLVTSINNFLSQYKKPLPQTSSPTPPLTKQKK
jgi:hypothetical protein